jgi:hypothetical protein
VNNHRSATIVAIFLTGIFILGIGYLVFGEHLGIKSPGPNARTDRVGTK